MDPQVSAATGTTGSYVSIHPGFFLPLEGRNFALMPYSNLLRPHNVTPHVPVILNQPAKPFPLLPKLF